MESNNFGGKLMAGFKKLIGNIKAKVKQNKEAKEKDNEWKQSIRDEAKIEAREEAKDELKKRFKEQEKQKLLKSGNPLQKLGEGLKSTGLGTDDKIGRLLGKSGEQKQSDSLGSSDRINKLLGKGPGQSGGFGMADKILSKKEVGYADVIKDNKVIYSADEQRTKDKNARIARMLGK
jgi:hypothetical protein